MSTGLGRSKRKPQGKVLVSPLPQNYKVPRASVGLDGLRYKMRPAEAAFSSNFLCFRLWLFYWCATVTSGWLCHWALVTGGRWAVSVVGKWQKRPEQWDANYHENIKPRKTLSAGWDRTHTRTHTHIHTCARLHTLTSSTWQTAGGIHLNSVSYVSKTHTESSGLGALGTWNCKSQEIYHRVD